MCFYNEDIIITGGRYNKKIKGNDCIIQILRKTSKAIEEQELLYALNEKFKIGFDVSKVLISKLSKLGFLEKNIIFSLNEDKPVISDNTKIKSFNIPTCLRPSQLSKCIKSYSSNFQKHSHYIDYYVFDDTPLGINKENYHVLKEIKKDLSTNIFYIDHEEKKKFIDLLVKESGIERNLLEFGFMPNKIFNNNGIFTAGANRNFILAYTIGDCFLTADDDSLCLGFKNNTGSEIHFSKGRGNINKKYINTVDLDGIANAENPDVFLTHENYIGKSLNDILYNQKIKNITCNMITESNEIFPNNYNFYENSKVHFTFNTTLGWPDKTSDEVLSEYLTNKNIEYLLGTSNSTIFESANADTIYSNPFLLTTTLTAMDNRSSICPFMPIFRNEDVHYSYFLNYLNPYSLSACVNISLLHDKKNSINQLEAFNKHFYSEIVLSYVLYILLNNLKVNLPKEYADINIRKKLFASTIKAICGKNKYDFTGNLLELKVDLKKLWYEKTNLIHDIHKNIEKDKIFMEISDYFMDFNKFLDNEQWEQIRRTLILYSDLLLEWDNIMEVCLKLKEQRLLPCKSIN